MTTQEVAEKLVAYNRENNHEQAYKELYDHEHIVSIENWGERAVHKGMEAIQKKGEQWFSSIEEMHETKVSDPLVSDRSFAVTFYMDVTYNDSMGPELAGRSQMTEMAVYRVNEDGKIYQEEFFA